MLQISTKLVSTGPEGNSEYQYRISDFCSACSEPQKTPIKHPLMYKTKFHLKPNSKVISIGSYHDALQLNIVVNK